MRHAERRGRRRGDGTHERQAGQPFLGPFEVVSPGVTLEVRAAIDLEMGDEQTVHVKAHVRPADARKAAHEETRAHASAHLPVHLGFDKR
jgi:hypothetical protein